jgi:hypothetical protein
MHSFIKKEITLRTILYYVFLFILLCLFVAYTLFQARFLLTGPIVTFTNQPEQIQKTRLITIEGIAENIVRMTLNGRQIYTDKNGYFEEDLVLENGYTVTNIQVHDRYGRSRSYIKEFVYTAPSP